VRRAARLLALAVGVAAAAALPAGCASDQPDLTVEQELVKLAGEPLSPAEINDRLELADLLCGFDRRVLERIWLRLDARQLEFQDFVFGQHCPERISSYQEVRPLTGTVAPSDQIPSMSSILDGIAPATTEGRTTSTGRRAPTTTTTASSASTTSRSTQPSRTTTTSTTSSNEDGAATSS
jgi:hypothetical protein